jgi:hypothetical protein
MTRGLGWLLVLSAASIPAMASAQEDSDGPPSEPTTSGERNDVADEGAATASPRAEVPKPVPVAPPAAETKPAEPPSPWRTEVHGYFRAPMALGISSRPNPDTPDGPSHTQWSYAPNRVMDWSYYSFAYTRLQEQDWAELSFHVKREHMDAVLGWNGYWLSGTGYRNADAAGVPGFAYLKLDTDFVLAGLTPNIALQMGAFWPGFGYFEKYDTFTLGRFRQMGEQLQLKVPLGSDTLLTLSHGVGTGRDGSYNPIVAQNSPLYASKTGVDLLTYAHLQVAYKQIATIGLHYNYEWTRDPRLTADASPDSGKAYSDAARAHLSVLGAEANVTVPFLGRVWLSPSYISVKNGWALAGLGGTEVMHSQNGLGIATNYLAFTNSPSDSTGTGSMMNLGFLYENTLSNVLGKPPGGLPDIKVSIFGLLARSSLDLPAGSQITQNKINQLKYGMDVTLQGRAGVALVLRGDTVNYDTDHAGYIFSALTSRLVFTTHFLSGESIYIQYSRYIYGNRMLLAGQWPWGTPLVAGTDVIQNYGPYFGQKPDANVLKLQASLAF